MLVLLLALCLQSIHVGPFTQAYDTSSVGPATAWWVFDLASESYLYIGPQCWQDVLMAPVIPANCRRIAWQSCELASDTVKQEGFLSCDLKFWYGVDSNGDHCQRGRSQSDAGCTLDGATPDSISSGYRDAIELRICGTSAPPPQTCKPAN